MVVPSCAKSKCRRSQCLKAWNSSWVPVNMLAENILGVEFFFLRTKINEESNLNAILHEGFL